MTNFASLLLLPQSFTIISVAGAGIAGFVIGIFIKYKIIAKQRKRILTLEDEMLSNHARILKLEKKNTLLKDDLSIKKDQQGNTQKVKLMAS